MICRGAFLRGETEAPSPSEEVDAHAEEEGAINLGVKSAPESTSIPLAAPLPRSHHGAKVPGRLAELYLFSIKDGGLLYQVPPIGLPPLEQADENEFMQWAYDTARKSVHGTEVVKSFEWKGQKVMLARGKAFFIVGRARGEDLDSARGDDERVLVAAVLGPAHLGNLNEALLLAEQGTSPHSHPYPPSPALFRPE